MDDEKNILVKAAAGSEKRNSRNAVISFAAANVAILGFFGAQLLQILTVLYLLFPVAILFGHLGKRDLRREPEKYKGFAMAQYGLVVGYFLLLLTVMALAQLAGMRIGLEEV
ncbi:MAG: DUF4190 domain-containing protein [Candidatus Hydrogenedentota bacterium]